MAFISFVTSLSPSGETSSLFLLDQTMVPLLLSVKAVSLQSWIRGLLQQTNTVEWDLLEILGEKVNPTALKYTQLF